jgi:hypothetical protein
MLQVFGTSMPTGGQRGKGRQVGLIDTIKGWFDKGAGSAGDVAGKATEEPGDTGEDSAGQAADEAKDLGARPDGKGDDAS